MLCGALAVPTLVGIFNDVFNKFNSEINTLNLFQFCVGKRSYF